MKKRTYHLLFLIIVIGITIFLTRDILFINDTTIMNQSEMENSEKEEIKKETEILNYDATPEMGVNVRNKAPNFVLSDSKGNTVQLNDFKGKKILLNFWTSWCKYCNAEMKDLIKFNQENKDSNIVILSINVTSQEKNEQDAINYISKNKILFPVFLDKENEITQMFRVQGYPTNLFIDENGVIQQRILGGITLEDIKVIFQNMK